MRMIISVVVGVLVSVALGTVGGWLLLAAAWSSIHGGDRQSFDPVFHALLLVTLVVPPAAGFFCGRLIYRQIGSPFTTDTFSLKSTHTDLDH